jgi:hypothetical protein
MTVKIISALGLSTFVVLSSASAQQPANRQPRRQAASRLPGAISVQEATELTNGWALLAEGQPAQAATRAARVLATSPRNGAALILAVEAEVARAGAAAALNQYEQWLGTRPLDEPAVVRRIAYAMLREEAAQQQEPAVRREALKVLAEEGDTSAAKTLAQPPSRGTAGDTPGSAPAGEAEPVDALITDLDRRGSEVRAIEALGASENTRAVDPLLQKLKDERIEVRGAAAEALGKIGQRDAVANLKPLLSDRNIYVRVKAAGALLRLDDDSGLPILQAMMLDPSADTRLAAADAMASRIDAAWLAAVRQLTEEPEPAVRAAAARLLAPHEPEIARTVLQSLASDENAAVRELAAQGLGEVMAQDLPTLRGLLRSPSRLTRVRAAQRVLALTR